MAIEFETDDFIQDEVTKTRQVIYKDREFTLKCSDPFGFWSIQPKDGPAPEVLSGRYTSFWDAEKAVEAYMNALTMKKEAIVEKRVAKKEARLNDSPS
jgi:hypothetical protein